MIIHYFIVIILRSQSDVVHLLLEYGASVYSINKYDGYQFILLLIVDKIELYYNIFLNLKKDRMLFLVNKMFL
jgi:hypothetical protein